MGHLRSLQLSQASNVGWCIMCLQQFTGQPTVLCFTTTIFRIFAVTRVDEFGRRTLLFLGIRITIDAYAIMAVAFLFQEFSDASVEHSAFTDFVLPLGRAFVTIFALMRLRV